MNAHADAIVHEFQQGRISRRQLVAQLMALGAAAAGFTGEPLFAQPAEVDNPTFTATSIDHLALHVTDVERSGAFYRKHLGLTVRRRDPNGNLFLSCRDRDFLALFPAEKAQMAHFSFSVPNYDADEAMKRLRAADLNPHRTANRVYFPDPDGLIVQVHE